MKKLLFFCFALLLFSVSVSAQDIITKKSGEDIKAKVLEVMENEIKYKLFDYLDGPTYTLRKSEILMIHYSNGTNEVINTDSSSDYNRNNYNNGQGNYRNPQPQKNNYQSNSYYDDRKPQQNNDWSGNNSGIRPGMKYRELVKYYDPSTYSPMYGDQYSTSRWLLNLIFPGLGQMTMGEIGRGFAWLGYSAGTSMVFTLIGGLVGDYDTQVLLTLVGAAGSLTIDILSMVDAAKVAKVKNLYYRDLNGYGFNPEFNLAPYLAAAPTSTGLQPAAGLSLRVTF